MKGYRVYIELQVTAPDDWDPEEVPLGHNGRNIVPVCYYDDSGVKGRTISIKYKQVAP